MANSLQVKSAMLTYLRYNRQFPLVTLETEAGQDRADILTVDEKGMLWNVEVKCSIPDLKNDIKKQVHRWIEELCGQGSGDRFIANGVPWYVPAKFYFAVPSEIREAAMKIASDSYPYAGVFSVTGGIVHVPRRAQQLHSQILDQKRQWDLVRAQSATLARLLASMVAADPVDGRWSRAKDAEDGKLATPRTPRTVEQGAA